MWQIAAIVLLAALPGLPAHGFSSAPYFPLAQGNQWSFQLNGGPIYTNQVLAPQIFNGSLAYPYFDSEDGSTTYYTNDASGIRVHGALYPADAYFCGVTSETDVYSPPFVIATPDVTLSKVIPSSGNIFVSLPGCGISSYPYTYQASSTIVGNETVTVPLGTFTALRVQLVVSVYDQGIFQFSESVTYWVAPNVGPVQTFYASFGETYRLTATNVVRTAPDAFAFPPLIDAPLGGVATSNSITVTGTTAAAAISVTGGEYSINGGPFTAAGGTIANGGTVRVRLTASSSPSTTTSATLTIGGVSEQFAVTTVSLPSHALTVQKVGTGTVTSSPAGINCGGTCIASYVQGTSVTLTATPGAGTPVFGGWTGGGCSGTGTCTVPMSGPTTVTATFLADTQAPTVPTGLTATAVSGSQVVLNWSASTDNVAMDHYHIYRGGIPVATVAGAPPATTVVDSGLAADTAYSYTVNACDTSENCSAQSSSASATTLAAGQYYFVPQLEPGFNLMGNALNAVIDIVALFGSQDAPTALTPSVVSIWKWNPVDGRWAFHSPQLSAAGNAAFAAPRGYDLLTAVNPGEGYWINANGPVALPPQSGTGFNWSGISFPALPSGFNLIATADSYTPSQFNVQVSETPPAPGTVPTGNFVSLWLWDPQAATWYFYSPLLEASGGLAAVKAYADSRFFRHFQDFGKTIGLGAGFWVNRP